MTKDTFEKRVQPVLQNVGLIGAGITLIAYIIIVIIMIFGFKATAILKTTTFALVNAIIGLVEMEFLKYQGQIIAENLPENKEITNRYYNKMPKTKKTHSIEYFWRKSIIKDVLMKGITLAATTIGIINIVIEGSGDYKLIWLAIVNILMFVSFGLLGLNKTYEFYNNQHIPYVLEQLNKIECPKKDKNEEEPQGEIEHA